MISFHAATGTGGCHMWTFSVFVFRVNMIESASEGLQRILGSRFMSVSEKSFGELWCVSKWLQDGFSNKSRDLMEILVVFDVRVLYVFGGFRKFVNLH